MLDNNVNILNLYLNTWSSKLMLLILFTCHVHSIYSSRVSLHINNGWWFVLQTSETALSLYWFYTELFPIRTETEQTDWTDERMDGWMTCDFKSFLTVFQPYQDDIWMIMKGCVQWNSTDGWEDFTLSEDRTWSARSAGQHLTHWATKAPSDERKQYSNSHTSGPCLF